MEIVIVVWEMVRRWLLALGPYVIVEVVLPGGTLLALGLYLYRRKQLAAAKILPTMSIRPAADRP